MGKVIVLGSGNMGSYVIEDLAKDYKVTAVDNNTQNLENIVGKDITRAQVDLSNPKNIPKTIQNADLVISALPEQFGYRALKTIIEAQKDVVDFSFWDFTENRMNTLQKIAQVYNSTAFYDCGVMPGLGGAQAANQDLLLDGKTQNMNIDVGGIGLDQVRLHIAFWSMIGNIEELLRDAQCRKEGDIKTIAALTNQKDVTFKETGRFEGYNTDGLRSLVYTLKHILNMEEFTLRRPGYFKQMKELKDMGYFNEQPIYAGIESISAKEVTFMLLNEYPLSQNIQESTLRDLGFIDDSIPYKTRNGYITPRDIAAHVLERAWKKGTEDKDMLLMRVQSDDGKNIYTDDTYAEHDGKHSAMAITTGGMASLAARYILEHGFPKKGAFPLEKVVQEKPEIMQYFIDGLQKKGVEFTQTKEQSR